MNRDDDIIKIDLDGVLRARMPRYYRFIPGWLVRRLERLIRQDELNGLLSSNAGKMSGGWRIFLCQQTAG